MKLIKVMSWALVCSTLAISLSSINPVATKGPAKVAANGSELVDSSIEAQKPQNLTPVANFQSPHVGGELLVTFEDKTPQSVKEKIALDSKAIEFTPVSDLDASTYLFTFSTNTDLKYKVLELDGADSVESVELNYKLDVGALPNETSFSDGSLWGMYGSVTSPANQFGSNAAAAWAAGRTGASDVYVAVVDTGIDASHPDLSANMWTNAQEVAGNGLDDDNNGFIDDIHGFDFLNNDGSTFDPGENEHGTHVAGIIGAKGNNSAGVVGVNWDVKIISAKFADQAGTGAISDAIRAFDYVTSLRTKKGLNIVASNNSWGGPDYSRALERAIFRSGDAGIVVVAAAGNDTRNLETNYNFPASYNCSTPTRSWDCVISVAAITANGSLAQFSNYGSTYVDLGAPGDGIYSTTPNNTYSGLSGTSMATPFVAGAVALCVASNKNVSAQRAKSLVLSTAAPTAALIGKTLTGARLDIGALVASCTGTIPTFSGTTASVRASTTYTDSVRLDWSAEVLGEYGYEIQVASGPAACTSGTFAHYAYIGPGITSYPVTGLTEATFYCFRVRANHSSGASAWVKSNLAITWTSNLPFIYGKVLLSDGETPVADLAVNWRASGGTDTKTVYTDKDGSYVLQASNGVQGNVWAHSPTSYTVGVQPSVKMPLNFRAGGRITVSADKLLNLTLPTFRTITLNVTDEATAQPVVNADIKAVSAWGDTLGCMVTGPSYMPNPDLTQSTESVLGSRYCLYGGIAGKSDSTGRFVYVALDAFYEAGTGALFPHKITVTHPTDRSVWQQNVNTNQDQTVSAVVGLNVTITGVVKTFTNSVVESANVTWTSSVNNSVVLTATTNASGAYSLKIPSGVSGTFRASGGTQSTPRGFAVLGTLSSTVNKVVDITYPRFRTISVTVTDRDTQAPVQGAQVVGTAAYEGNYIGCQISAADYSPSPGLSYPSRTCITGLPSGSTNASGTATFTVLDAFYEGGTNALFPILFTATDPTNSSRVAQTTVNTNANNSGTIQFVGQPLLTGHVYMNDGVTPVQNLAVKWQAAGSSVTSTVTDSSGAFSMLVSPNVRGTLWVETSSTLLSAAPMGTMPTPQLPLGFWLGGQITLTADKDVTLTMPVFRTIRLNVVDVYTNDPVPYAEIVSHPVNESNLEIGKYLSRCAVSANDFSPSSDLSYSGFTCHYLASGKYSQTARADVNGNITLVVIDAFYEAGTGNDFPYYFTAQHPSDAARAGRVWVSTLSSSLTEIVIPGTPAKPNRPSLTTTGNSLTLNWQEPWDGSAFIDYYEVWVATDVDGPYELATGGTCLGRVAPTARSCTVTNLQAGITYYFAIIAHNEVGSSARSTAASFTPTVAILETVTQPGSSSGSSGGGSSAKELPVAPTVIQSPKLSGKFSKGQMIIAENGEWKSDWPLKYSYRWLRCDAPIAAGYSLSSKAGCKEIEAEVGKWYSPNDSDMTKFVTVEITATDESMTSVFYSDSVYSSTLKSLVIANEPALIGTFKVGKTLKIEKAIWGTTTKPTKLSYQWYRCAQVAAGASSLAGANCKAVAGATKSTYLVTKSDKTKYLSARVVATNGKSKLTYASGTKLRIK